MICPNIHPEAIGECTTHSVHKDGQGAFKGCFKQVFHSLDPAPGAENLFYVLCNQINWPASGGRFQKLPKPFRYLLPLRPRPRSKKRRVMETQRTTRPRRPLGLEAPLELNRQRRRRGARKPDGVERVMEGGHLAVTGVLVREDLIQLKIESLVHRTARDNKM